MLSCSSSQLDSAHFEGRCSSLSPWCPTAPQLLLLSFPGHHGSPYLCRNIEDTTQISAKNLALENLSSKSGGKTGIYEMIVANAKQNMIKDLNGGGGKIRMVL